MQWGGGGGEGVCVSSYMRGSFTLEHLHTQALVLEEMPPFAEKESSLLSKLHKSAPWTAKLHNTGSAGAPASSSAQAPAPATQSQPTLVQTTPPAPVVQVTCVWVCGCVCWREGRECKPDQLGMWYIT